MHPTTIERYREYRTLGVSSAAAFHWARTPEVPDLFDGEDFASWEGDGFRLDAHLVVDDLYDLSYLGTFSDRWEEGAFPIDLGRHASGWFVPTNSERDQYVSLRDLKLGRAESRRLARRHVLEDRKRFAEFGDRW